MDIGQKDKKKGAKKMDGFTFEEMMADAVFENLLSISNQILDALDGVSGTGLMTTVLATTLDQWAADNDVTAKELEEALSVMVVVMKDAHEFMGLPEKSK